MCCGRRGAVSVENFTDDGTWIKPGNCKWLRWLPYVLDVLPGLVRLQREGTNAPVLLGLRACSWGLPVFVRSKHDHERGSCCNACAASTLTVAGSDAMLCHVGCMINPSVLVL